MPSPFLYKEKNMRQRLKYETEIYETGNSLTSAEITWGYSVYLIEVLEEGVKSKIHVRTDTRYASKIAAIEDSKTAIKWHKESYLGL